MKGDEIVKDFNINKKRNDEYYTPNYVLDHFCKFEYDPCTTEKIAQYHKIKYYDTIETNGLLKDWSKYKTIWLNPPFTNKKLFLEKAVETYRNNKNCIYILLPINYLISKQFQNLPSNWNVYIPNKRINFLNENGITKNCSFGSVIVRPSLFDQIFFINF